MKPVLVVGDSLLDRDIDGPVTRLAPDAPVPVVNSDSLRSRPGGAGLAACLMAAEGRPVTLVTAIASDAAGEELLALLEHHGVTVLPLPVGGATPEKIRIRGQGHPMLRLDRGGEAGLIGGLTTPAAEAIATAATILIADYGRGVAAHPSLREALAPLVPRVPVVWDPHPKGPDPVPGVRLITPNSSEAEQRCPDVSGAATAAAAARASRLRERWHAGGVVVTLGSGGAVLSGPDGPPLVVLPPSVSPGDPCGAGDRFAGAAAAALADGALLSEAVQVAVNTASKFVAAGGAAAFGLPPEIDLRSPPPPAPADEVIARVRAEGGTVVATGGCFDLLHAGHVALLESARQLGDCLVVCLNSDASVRRLKGPTRPLQSQADRAAVLMALGCVDAVAVFDEDTPVPLLQQLRPDVFCKGADYAVADLPESAALAAWGGQAVVLPYLPGRSTTRLVEEATRQASSR